MFYLLMLASDFESQSEQQTKCMFDGTCVIAIYRNSHRRKLRKLRKFNFGGLVEIVFEKHSIIFCVDCHFLEIAIIVVVKS